ncbi:hypothetical protein PIB30_081343 [Stylosanthes scabra]|uniref:Uncharacterized protein n=1 Tax=Stylosanthes scabra TaxID=79078 RepID=A0ABU6UR24_9FABA|nr:hypothetical protein [Stylosanthes scabra]
MASPASSHTETNEALDHALPPPPPQHETVWISETITPSADTVAQPSTMITEANVSSLPTSSKEKKKKKKTEDKKIVSTPPKFLVADTMAPLNEEGFLKAPKSSIETSELWNSQRKTRFDLPFFPFNCRASPLVFYKDVSTNYFKARVIRIVPQLELRSLLLKWKARLRSTYRDVWVKCGINQALQLATCDLSYHQPLLGGSLYF